MIWHFSVLFLAIVFDRFLGDPDVIWRRIPHPVVLFGKAISYLDRELNREEWRDKDRFWAGWSAILFLILCAAVIGFFIYLLCLKLGWFGIVIEALIASVFLAQKGLKRHVKAVFDAFRHQGLSGARKTVAMIVGRDPEKLDETGVSSAAIESLAENTSDGIVAPVFWFALFGLSGLFAYKMLNTADSMIGHLNERYRYFGYGTAKLDDIANYIPARLTALLVLLVIWITQGKAAVRHCRAVVLQDAGHHRSPNAGWPEAAFAAGLDIQLAGPRFYNGIEEQEPFLNQKGRPPARQDISRALRLFNKTMSLMAAIIACFVIISLFTLL